MKTSTILTALGGMLAFNTQVVKRPLAEQRSSCTFGLVFEVENQWDQTLDLDNNDCYTRLKNEIYGCDHGGESTISKWRFRADPGNC
ncbi:hypothetical protein LZL87_011166 [Fusarium oxysporum]|uniref:Uncharacterized protein n=1 Tax=Fusarium oxysporum f. sp. rapae TaxID=485398 RepID=A0A8J5U1H8_FUSOX|nr:hypothetical protein Forpe1208_v012698 [Fusarium oxysporum f. sp. rapae]KAI7763023.1 hypothetical protein LZL87_011166 [Fusarium oxysporum]